MHKFDLKLISRLAGGDIEAIDLPGDATSMWKKLLPNSQTGRRLTAREAARFIVCLARVGNLLLGEGHCLGPVSLDELNVSGPFPTRNHLPGLVGRTLAAGIGQLHLLMGHDLGCREFGISVTTLRRLLNRSAGRDVASFLVEVVIETVAERTRWSDIECARISAVDHLTLNLERRITPARNLPKMRNGTIIAK